MLWIAHGQTDQKTVELGFRQQLCAGGACRVLCRDHDKRFGKPARCALDAHLPLFHNLEECRLGFGRGPVDLIGKQQIAEYGSFLKFKYTLLIVVHGETEQIAGEDIRRELDSPVIEGEHARKGGGERCLSNARYVLHQNMPSADDGSEHFLYDVLFSLDDAVYGFLNSG